MGEALTHAIDNNIHLCTAVLAQFEAEPETRDCATLFHGPRRPFYPSVITRDLHLDDATQAHIQSLPTGAGVKDSFAVLDLADLGFTPVMSAQWIARRGHSPSGPPHQTATITTLNDWRKAWGDDAQGQSNFTPALLGSPKVALHHSADMTSGIVTNSHTAGVTGISNIFGTAEPALAGLADVPQSDLIVGYDTSPEPFLSMGFETLGPLIVWIKTG